MSWQGWVIIVGGSWLVLALLVVIALGRAFKSADIRADELNRKRKDQQ